jgi:segregation and condensation protein A
MADYQVDLDTFRGPLDLLLYLVKRNEVDICDIPIALIAEQYLHYLELIRIIDVERAGDFLVMASTLMEIKSRSLLPRTRDEDSEDEDPRTGLVKQLMEYKQFKDLAQVLEQRADEQGQRMARTAQERPTALDPLSQPVGRVEIWDLVSAFSRLMRETLAAEPSEVLLDDTPMHVWMEELVGQLQAKGRTTFADVFAPPHTRRRLLGLFLALLELIKMRRVLADQPEALGPIWIELTSGPMPTAPELQNGPLAEEVHRVPEVEAADH